MAKAMSGKSMMPAGKHMMPGMPAKEMTGGKAAPAKGAKPNPFAKKTAKKKGK